MNTSVQSALSCADFSILHAAAGWSLGALFVDLIEHLEILRGFFGVAELFAETCGFVVSAGAAGLLARPVTFDCGAVFIQSSLQVSAFLKKRSQLHEGLGVVGINCDGLDKIRLGISKAILMDQQRSQVDQRPLSFVFIRRVDLDRKSTRLNSSHLGISY